jgi:hypothetical protein
MRCDVNQNSAVSNVAKITDLTLKKTALAVSLLLALEP